jgi:hypothetical protein
MPSLPNISGYGQGVTNINVKDLDVVTLSADLVSTDELVVGDIVISVLNADVATLKKNTRYVTSTEIDKTDISGGLTVDSGTLRVDATNKRIGINSSSPPYTFSVVDNGNAVYPRCVFLWSQQHDSRK